MIELKEGQYIIPDGLTFDREGNTLTVRKSRKKPRATDFRCKDCVFHSVGRAVNKSSYNTYVCLLKPKSYKDIYGKQCYFAARMNAKPCEKFLKRK